MSGFWCVEFRDEPDQPEYLAECYRTEDTCRKQREGASKSGMIVTECELSDRAHCFDVTQPQQHKIYWRCYETSYHCAVERAKYRKANPQPDLFFSECVLTAGHGGATPNEVRARVAGNRRLSSVRANRER